MPDLILSERPDAKSTTWTRRETILGCVLAFLLLVSIIAGVFAALVDHPVPDPASAGIPNVSSSCGRLILMYTRGMNPDATPDELRVCVEQRTEGTIEFTAAAVVALGSLAGLVVLVVRRRRRLGIRTPWADKSRTGLTRLGYTAFGLSVIVSAGVWTVVAIFSAPMDELASGFVSWSLVVAPVLAIAALVVDVVAGFRGGRNGIAGALGAVSVIASVFYLYYIFFLA